MATAAGTPAFLRRLVTVCLTAILGTCLKRGSSLPHFRKIRPITFPIRNAFAFLVPEDTIPLVVSTTNPVVGYIISAQ
jgi:hypothetical protein